MESSYTNAINAICQFLPNLTKRIEDKDNMYHKKICFVTTYILIKNRHEKFVSVPGQMSRETTLMLVSQDV